VLTTNEKLLIKQGTAVLHFMPLPGKVKEIYRADKDTFIKAKKLVRKKLELNPAVGLGVFMEKTIGAHNIFVWKLDEPNEFPRRVQQYVLKRFGPNSKAQITPRMFEVVKDYYKRGFRYFAFDLVLMTPNKTTKEAIAYHFESPSVYYPLVISSAAAKGDTLIDLVVFSKGELTMKKINDAEVKKLGNKTVTVTYDELAAIDAPLAKLFGADSTIRGRILQIMGGKLESFTNDFEAH